MSVNVSRINMRRQQGFTLLEVLVSIAIMGLVIGYFVSNRMEQLKVQLGENIAQEIMTLTNHAISFYAESGSGAGLSEWPDQSSACSGAISRLQTEGYLPSGYTPNPVAAITTSCMANGSFDITVAFSLVDEDLAKIVKTALPSAEELPVTAGATTRQIRQRVFRPRRMGKNYTFSRSRLTHGRVDVPVPSCANPRFIAIPQTICVDHNQGLQGYFFHAAQHSSNWRLTLCVGTLSTGPGTGVCDNSSGGGGGPGALGVFYRPHHHDCDGNVPEIGVITYCE